MIRKSSFHYHMILINGERKELNKVVEEMKELEDAVEMGYREGVVEEFADVLNVLPYLSVIFGTKIKPFILPIQYSGYNSEFFREIIYFIIEQYSGNKVLFRNLLKETLKFYLAYLTGIQHRFNITNEEVEEWIELKRERCLSEVVGKTSLKTTQRNILKRL